MKVEFYRLLENGTWDTVVKDIPSDADPEKYAKKMTCPDVVLFGVYHENLGVDDEPEGDEEPPEDDELPWIERHSVTCIACGDLVDERECFEGQDGEGSVCPKCHRGEDVAELHSLEEYGYTPVEKVDPNVAQAIKDARQRISSLLSAMKINITPVVVEPEGRENDVARYVAETRDNALIVIFQDKFSYLGVPFEMRQTMIATLVHESIHAFLDYQGLNTCDHDEDFVESMTRKWCHGDLNSKYLVSVLEEEAANAE
jgi:hypothetical protein